MNSTNGLGAPQQSPHLIPAAASTGVRLASVSAATISCGYDSNVRAGRIAALRLSISAGTYRIPASAVAAKMLTAILH